VREGEKKKEKKQGGVRKPRVREEMKMGEVYNGKVES
jgi:hypothetical protein